MLSPLSSARSTPGSGKASFIQVRQIVLVCALSVFAVGLLAAPVPTGKPMNYPAWWFSQGVIVSTNPTNSAPNWPGNYPAPDDFAVINEGQLKNLATKAYAELQAKAPTYVWSTSQGTALTAMVTVWSPTVGDDYGVINLGQLKTVAKPFYDVLTQIGYTQAYPWTGGGDDYAAANTGQTKNLFSFDVGLDSDNDGLPDWWEMKYFGHLGNSATALAPAGNGLTLLQDYNQGNDPTNYYSQSGAIITPTLTIVSGNSQTGTAGAFVTNPLVVLVKNSSNVALSGAPVTFTLAAGANGGLATSSGGATSTAISVRTDTNGHAQVNLELATNVLSTGITVTTGTATPVNFTATATTLPTLAVVSGDAQSGLTGVVLPLPVVIQATGGTGQPLGSVPLALTMVQGTGTISNSATGGFNSTLTINTGANGQAAVYFKPQGAANAVNQASCTATATGGAQRTVSFSATVTTAAAPGGGSTPGTDSTNSLNWGGTVTLVEADVDNVSSDSYPSEFDPTRMDIHWTPTTGTGIDGFVVEKKVSAGQWTQLASVNAGTPGYCEDTGLLANQLIQYRVTPYTQNLDGTKKLWPSSAPIAYEVPLIKGISIQTSSGGGTQQGYVPSPNLTNPAATVHYLTATSTGSQNTSDTYEDSSGEGTDTETHMGSYTSTLTYVPDHSDPEHGLNYIGVYSGGIASRTDDFSDCFGNVQDATANATEDALGNWTGTLTQSGVQDNVSFNEQSSIDYAPWGPSPGSVTYSNVYTTAAFIADVNQTMTPYTAWEPQFDSPVGPQTWGAWSLQMDYTGRGVFLTGSRLLSISSEGYPDQQFQVTATKYKFRANPATNGTFRWAEIFYPADQSPPTVTLRSWTINSSSPSDGTTYEVNPATNGGPDGNYYLAQVPQMDVYSNYYNPPGTQPTGFLDSTEKTQTGSQVLLSNGTLTGLTGVGQGGFSISGGTPQGTSYQLSWSGTDANTFQVWGYNYATQSWQSVTNGSSVVIVNPGTNPTSGWAGSFEVVATQPTQNNDSINLTLTASAPGGVQYTADTAKFFYAKPTSNFSMPIDEASGTRYRKIALNGLPMPDEKPQQSGETDQEKEETYVDALTLGLRHSTTDVYLPVSGSDIAVSARRDFRSQVWSVRYGLRPHEQPDLPFGMGWSSNLSPNIKFVTNNDPAKTQPDQAIVTDETGAVHTFVIWYSGGAMKFFPMPTAKNEQQVPNLETLTVNSTTPVTYTFKRKYGTTLTYQGVTTLNLQPQNDRLLGSQYVTTYNYARLTQAVDRLGNTINYQFQVASSLIPSTITVANQPDVKISIQQQQISALISGSTNPQSVVTAIWDAKGNKTSYHYSASPHDPTSNLPCDPSAVVLSSITTPDGATTTYTYSGQYEADQTPVDTVSDPGNAYVHVDLASITDPLSHAYHFTYALDHSRLNYMNNPVIYTGYYTQCGLPCNVTKVSLPDDTTSHPDFATFSNPTVVKIGNDSSGNIALLGSIASLSIGNERKNTITDAMGSVRTYIFSDAQVVPIPQFPDPVATNVVSANVVAYKTLTIQYDVIGADTEQFQFDINANMAVKQVTDLSGHITSFAHADQWHSTTASTDYVFIAGATMNGYYDDPTSETDAMGNIKTYAYSSGSRIMTSITTPRPTTANPNYKLITTYGLDSLGRRTSEIMSDSNGSVIQETDFAYGSSTYPGFMTSKTIKKLSGISDPSWVSSGGLVTQYIPDLTDGRLAQEIVDPSGLHLVTSYTYDANGNKLSSTDPRGNTTSFSYDSRNRLVTVTNPDGSQKQITYDSRGNKLAEYDENGLVTQYQYDSLNRMIVEGREGINTLYTYNNDNTKTSINTPNNGFVLMQYDNFQRLTDVYTSPDNTVQYHSGYGYGNSGGNVFDSSSFKPVTIVDPRGFATQMTYDNLYRPTVKSVQYDTGHTSTTGMTYDAVGNLTSTTDPLGNVTSTTFDALNRPVQTTYADGSIAQTSYTSTGLKYQVKQQVSGTTSPQFEVSQTQYDGAGRPTEVFGAYGTPIQTTTTTTYDAAGNVLATVNPLGNEWDYTYDSRNRKTQEQAPAVVNAVNGQTVRPTTTWQYDSAGRLLDTVDPRGNRTDNVYDNLNRKIEVIGQVVNVPGGNPTRPVTQMAYDNNGNVTTVTDANGHATNNTYDLLNRLLTTVDAAGNSVGNGYDSVGNKTTVTDGNSHTTTFAYDGLNRNTSITDAAGHATTFHYNALNKDSRTNALSQTTSYAYDARNRLITVTYPVNNATNATRHYSYDDVGNLLGVTEPAKSGVADVAYGYDLLNRVTSETSSGLTHAYVYDLAGNRTSTTYGGTGRSITSSYDALNRLGSMTESGRTTSYGYDLNGNIVTKGAANGDTETATFDALNRSTAQVATTWAGTLLYSYAYSYDLAGNVVTVGEAYPTGLNSRTVTNTYDAANRLHVEAVTGAAPNTTTTYGYDSANNRTSKAVLSGGTTVTTSYAYNNLNQLTGYNNGTGTRTVALTYDLNGNRATRVVTGGTDNGTDTYTYDIENRLVGLVKGTAGGAGTYAYAYDYRTRRVTRDESSASGFLTHVIFSGGTSAQEYTGTISSGNLAVELIRGSDYGGGVGGILYTLRGGNPSYTHENRRGDVVAKTDSSGNLTFQTQYEAFGNQVATSGNTSDRQKSNSKDTDPTGLVDEGFRYRDLETGMFINRDPAGFVDGPNLYTYVIQNPWTKFDPEGLSPELMSNPDDPDHSTNIKMLPSGYRQVQSGGPDFRNSAEVNYANYRLNGDQASFDKFTNECSNSLSPSLSATSASLAFDDPVKVRQFQAQQGAIVLTGLSGGARGSGTMSPSSETAEAINAQAKENTAAIAPTETAETTTATSANRAATEQPVGGNGVVLKTGEGATAGEMAASTGGSTGGLRAGQAKVRQNLIAAAQSDGSDLTCWRCGQSTKNPDNMHLGHRNVPVSQGGNLSCENVTLEGAACNLSAGNREGTKPGRSCADRGSCGAPYGRND